MFFKKKGFFLFIFLILLQSCSGGRIGNFFEISFANLENTKKGENTKNIIEKKKDINLENKEPQKKNIKKIKIKENTKNIIEKKKDINLEKKIDTQNRTNRENKTFKKRKNELQSYKIIFILKDVDPKDPIEELSTILRDSEVNFEIEKIERFIDPKNKSMKRN